MADITYCVARCDNRECKRHVGNANDFVSWADLSAGCADRFITPTPAQQLDAIAAMPDGPHKPSAATIEHARRLLSFLRRDVPPPQIQATDGYVYLHWGRMMVEVSHDG